MAGLSVAFMAAALTFRSRATGTDALGLRSELLLVFATLPCWLLLAKLHGLYDRDEEHAAHGTVDDLLGIVKVVTIVSWFVLLGSWVSGAARPYPPKLFAFWAFAILLVVGSRAAARAICRHLPAYVQNTVLVGAGDVGALLVQKFRDRPEYGVRVVGFVDDEGSDERLGDHVPYLGSTERLPDLVRRLEVERVVVGFPSLPRSRVVALVRELRGLDVQVDVVPRLFELVSPNADINTVQGLPLIGLPALRADRAALAVKRAVDVGGAALGLVLLAPVFGWIALRIRLDSPGPVFYRHQRIGVEGRPFRLLKFRTMYVEDSIGDEYGGEAARREFLRVLEDPERRREFERSQKLVDDPRVTRFGAFLRRLSLDELPQLVNVLRGDMSIVGPRPVTEAELVRYGGDVASLLVFRPGITGYWQVNGRSQTDWDDRVRLDLAYAHGWSLKLDFLILGKTVWVLLKSHGAY